MRTRLGVVAVLVLAVSACGPTDETAAPTPTLTSFPKLSEPTAEETTATPSELPSVAPEPDDTVTKVLVFIEENHSLAQMKSGMPYAFSLAKQFGYAEDMTENCATSNGGDEYAVRHNPWAYFTAERELCRKFDEPESRLGADIDAGRLPHIGMVIPNNCNNAHDCSLLTADEDDKESDNIVLTVVIHPSQKGKVVKVTSDPLLALQVAE